MQSYEDESSKEGESKRRVFIESSWQIRKDSWTDFFKLKIRIVLSAEAETMKFESKLETNELIRLLWPDNEHF